MSYEFDRAETAPTGDLSTGVLVVTVIAAAQVVWLGPLVWMVLRSICSKSEGVACC